MPRFGRGRGLGGGGFGRGYWGLGTGRGYWGPGAGLGYRGYGYWLGWGWGNPYPFCRFYPWLPRRWWAYGAWPFWSYAVPPWGVPPWGAYVPPTVAPEAELSALKAQAQWLKSQLDAIEGRIKELEKEG